METKTIAKESFYVKLETDKGFWKMVEFVKGQRLTPFQIIQVTETLSSKEQLEFLQKIVVLSREVRNIIYDLIRNNPLKYNSVTLGLGLGIPDKTIRVEISEISKDIHNFEFGIISIGQKYKLADSIEDISAKKSFYMNQHKHLTDMTNIWEARTFNVLGDQLQKEIKND